MRFRSMEEEIIFTKLMNGYPESKREIITTGESTGEITIDHSMPINNITVNEYFTEISQRIATMETTRINHPNYMMPKQSFYHPVKKMRYFAKRVIRKSINWALGSSFDKQTEFNNSVVPAIGRLTELQSMAQDNISQDKLHITQSAERIAALEGKAEEAGQTAVQSAERIAALEWKAEKTGQTAAQNAKRIATLEGKAEEAGQTAAQNAERIAALEGKAEEAGQTAAQNAERIAALEGKAEEAGQTAAQNAERIAALEGKAEEARQTAAQNAERIAALEGKAEEAGQTTAQNVERITALEGKAEEAGRTTAQSAERIAALEGKIQVLEQWLIQNAKVMESVNESVRIMEEQGIIQQTRSIKKADARDNLAKHSLSQSGEDTILAYILNARGIPAKDCTYLDLGANHAKQYSNTYYFYDKGARGVLIEANPALIPELKLYRNEDVILNCCIGAEEGEPIDFYVLNGDGLSTPDKKRVDEVIALNPTLKIDRIVSVKTMTVNSILDKYFDNAPVYMNIDLEGDDLAILSSIDLEKHRPLMISIEMIPYRPRLVVGEKDDDVMRFMEEHEYIEYAFTGINSIFLDKRQIKDVFL